MEIAERTASFWARLFRCSSDEAARDVIGAEPGRDAAWAEGCLAAWTAHRAASARDEARATSRARDAEALVSLGHRLSDARSLDDLASGSAEAISRAIDADAVALAWSLPERSRTEVFLARPLAPGDEERLRRAAAGGLLPSDAPAAPAARLAAFDGLAGPRRPMSGGELLVVPVVRRGGDAAHVAVLPSGPAGERDLRVLYGAASHLAAHLDRVIAVTEAEQGRFRAILDSMPHAVLLVDPSFRIARANASAERLLASLGPQDETLRAVGDLDLAAVAYDVLTGRTAEAGAEAVLGDGRRLEVSIAPWRDPGGALSGLVVVMLDVTTARRLSEQIAQSERLSGLGRMIAGVAHEINNPLTTVIGYAQLLRGTPPGEKSERRLQAIQREAERCRRIVQNLLRFARPHAPERRPFSLNEVADNVAQLLSYQVRSSGSRLALELDRELPAVIGDAHAVEQALVNLVTNAQQALSGAGRPGTIVLRTARDPGGNPFVEVEDDGPGIPEDLRARVFDPFFTTKPVGQGSGLGLWLVYTAMAEQGGRAEASAAPSGGARVRLTLAAGGAVAPAVPAEDPFEEAPRVSARILVLDAEAALAGLICEALEGEGHRAIAVPDPQDALALLAREPFDLVVSDLALPGLSGERLAREVLRVRPELAERILLTTGDWIDREPEAEARRLGAGLLRKPFEIDELARAVRRRLARAADH